MYKARINKIDILGIGMAGIGCQKDIRRVKNNLLPLNQVINCFITNDGEIAVLGSYAGEPGIVVVAGTGSIVYGLKANGVTARAGGWGPLLGDEGSGFWIGLKALQAIIKAEEGRYVNTSLSNILMDFLNINNLRELFTFVYQQKLPREKIASLAPLVIEAMKNKDQIARKIIEEGCDELIMMVKVVARELNYQKKEIAVTGGLFNNPPFYNFCSAKFKKAGKYKAIKPIYPAVYGAIFYGALKTKLNLFFKKNEK